MWRVQRGVHSTRLRVFLLRQGLDTSTPSDPTIFQMLGLFLEFEAVMIRERARVSVARNA
ncbi:MAG: recombinase family protein [Rhizomicrobium sp.]